MINLTLINPQIFVGTYPQNDVDLDRLKAGPKISAVLNLQTDADFKALRVNWPRIKQGYLEREMRCERWPIVDFSPEDLERRLRGAADLLRDLVGAGHRVYVHCTAGVGRSPATVIGYLAWHKGMDLDEAYNLVKSLRACDPYIDAIRAVHMNRNKDGLPS